MWDSGIPYPDTGNIYEELKRRRISRDVEKYLGEPQDRKDDNLELEVEEEADDSGDTLHTSYDHLNFSRPSQELKPHYQSTDTMRSSPIAQSRPASGGSDFAREVLSSVENLGSMTRKTIYEPETDSGVSSGQHSTTVPLPIL